MEDDMAEFEAAKRAFAANLAGDPELPRRRQEMVHVLARHSFPYLWTWAGLPIIQNPEDIVVLQEIIWAERPDLIIETGVARGGSVVFFASLLELLGEGEIVGVDIDIRAHNRKAIEESPFAGRIHLIEGPSTDSATLGEVRERLEGRERVMVVLDSDHTHQHVLEELRAYAPMVTPGQFLVVADTTLEICPTPIAGSARPWGIGNNPMTALNSFLAEDSRFAREVFHNQRLVISSNIDGYVRRIG